MLCRRSSPPVRPLRPRKIGFQAFDGCLDLRARATLPFGQRLAAAVQGIEQSAQGGLLPGCTAAFVRAADGFELAANRSRRLALFSAP